MRGDNSGGMGIPVTVESSHDAFDIFRRRKINQKVGLVFCYK